MRYTELKNYVIITEQNNGPSRPTERRIKELVARLNQKKGRKKSGDDLPKIGHSKRKNELDCSNNEASFL